MISWIGDKLTLSIAVYGAVLGTIGLGWNIYKDLAERRRKTRERTKVRLSFGIPVVKRGIPNFGKVLIFPLCIMNLGSEDVIIVQVELRHKNSKFHPGAYNEPEAALGIKSERLLPRRLNPGDTLELEQFTLAAFREWPTAIVAYDSEGGEHSMLSSDLASHRHWVEKFQTKESVRLTEP